MADPIYLLAVAHVQGIRAGMTPTDSPPHCPWPVEYHDACVAWFAGYSVAVLAGSAQNLITEITEAV